MGGRLLPLARLAFLDKSAGLGYGEYSIFMAESNKKWMGREHTR